MRTTDSGKPHKGTARGSMSGITLETYLNSLGFDEREQKIYLCLSEIGLQPASVVARTCHFDRVTTYKHLKKLAEQGFVTTYFRNGIQHFGIESYEALEHHLKDNVQTAQDLLDEFPLVEQLLKSRKESDDMVPKLQIFEGDAGMKSFFRDMLHALKQEKLRQIRMLTSNTFEERLGNVTLGKFVKDFFNDIRKLKIDLEVFEATGSLIPERLKKTSQSEFDPERLPAARGTTSIFLAGNTVYIACYRHTQIGLKITQSEISQIFHFLFDFIGRQV